MPRPLSPVSPPPSSSSVLVSDSTCCRAVTRYAARGAAAVVAGVVLRRDGRSEGGWGKVCIAPCSWEMMKTYLLLQMTRAIDRVPPAFWRCRCRTQRRRRC